MFDVGGNIGAFALPLADCLRKYSKDNNSLVITVEPLKNSSQKMRTSIKRNNLDNIHLYEYALTKPGANDTVRIRDQFGNHGHTCVVKNPSSKEEIGFAEYEVPATTIDAITKIDGNAMKRIFFMKMDIEGYEPVALQGAEEFMKNGPCIIFAELQNTHTKKTLVTGKNPLDKQLLADTGSDFKSTIKLMLRKWGYVQYKSDKGTGGLEGWFMHQNMRKCLARLHEDTGRGLLTM